MTPDLERLARAASHEYASSRGVTGRDLEWQVDRTWKDFASEVRAVLTELRSHVSVNMLNAADEYLMDDDQNTLAFRAMIDAVLAES